jgi:hypothetical protein
VPYAGTVPIEGSIYLLESPEYPARSDGVLVHYVLNGLHLIYMSAHDLFESLRPRIIDDPYHFVK